MQHLQHGGSERAAERCRQPGAGADTSAAGPESQGVEGVLLFYAYRDLSRGGAREAARDWFQALCTEQGLVGRVRIALDGLNATLGGSLAALRQHAEAVEARFGAGGAPIDFKLAESSGRRSAATMRQSGFDRLSVQMCKEVVSLGLPDFLPSATSNDDGGGDASLVLPAGARHVEPEEFHAMLAAAAGSGCGSVARGGGSQGSDGGSSVGGSSRETVLIDTRNFYETQVGRFEVPGVALLDPQVRCFSDTPAWLDANQHRLANRRIMMYCTGGVVSSGTWRPTQAAASSVAPTLCLTSEGAWREAAAQQQATAAAGSGGSGRRLRILCLHGFRQTARNFEGRTHGLRKRLRDVAEFVFVDGPHQLPAWTKPPAAGEAGAEADAEAGAVAEAVAEAGRGPSPGSPPVRQESQEAAVGDLDAELAAELAAILAQQQADCEDPTEEEQRQRQQQPQRQGRQQEQQGQLGGPPRRAWLLVPEQYAALQHPQQEEAQEQHSNSSAAPGPGLAAGYVDEWQFQAQTAGWRQSEQLLSRVLGDQGPWDGVLGFSQGAAVAGFLAARQWLEAQQQQQQQQRHHHHHHQEQQQQEQQQQEQQQQEQQLEQEGFVGAARPGSSRPLLRFAILCSGYRSPLPEHRRVLKAAAAAGGAALPTLHIYGTGTAGWGEDRQIGAQHSAELADCFDPTQRFVVRHAGGHVIPASKAVAGRLHDFLAHVQHQEQQQQQDAGQQQRCPSSNALEGKHPAQADGRQLGKDEHLELRMAVRQAFREELAKPPGQRDPQRVRDLCVQGLRLIIEDCELHEKLSAALERRPIRLVAVAHLELPQGTLEEMRGVPAMDLCSTCHKNLDLIEIVEEQLRQYEQQWVDGYRKSGCCLGRRQWQQQLSSSRRRLAPRTLLRFAILCSGYRSPLPEHRRALEAAAAAGANDRQIGAQHSAELADCFDPTGEGPLPEKRDGRFVVRHAASHIIPASKAVAGRLRDFLAHMQQQQQGRRQDAGQQQRVTI
ncbi:hypothetical protein CHLNCDRAFT_57621 [Chlorella variabilis]|uniref:Rhodanese domain-containing protein n=1 Tax=Chlorella variabilis TaxID=554065 RepID=E1ZD98_CHLVA|nr:hypothetical protein CHLNCDRAFT_57621 [Chlorella variabilis]EFN56380.1 hypothetical protein CHLNCDRAFT_57621 [Chlorella variabilis]|eukprot:XP_005848482.1 hypothetical protein CHLNCDRAFT_57621 [Chlorella variabilis]